MAYSALQFNTNALYQAVTQTNHMFSVGDVLRFNGTIFVTASNTSAVNSQVVGMVSSIVNPDQFYLTQEGFVSGLTTMPSEGGAYGAGTLYYLSSSAGLITAVKPVAVGLTYLPCYIAYTPTSGFFFASVGELIESGELFAWNIVGVDTPMLVNNGYLTSSGGTLNMTLPPTAVIGDTIKLANLSGNFTIVQNAGQSINLGNDTTTIGVGGSITSMAIGDSIELVCYNANSGFQVLNSMGNFTIV